MVQVTNLSAHDLPLSELQIVASQNRLHAEISLNSWELTCFAELDRDHNGVLSPQELTEREEQLAALVVASLELKVDGRALQPQISGLVPLYNTHHLSFRAHYALKQDAGVLEVSTRLSSITHAGHVVEILFRRGSSTERVRLLSSEKSARFELNSTVADPSSPGGNSEEVSRPEAPGANSRLAQVGLALMLLTTVAYWGNLAAICRRSL